MGPHAIGVNRQVPCVGSPDGEMFACGAEGSVSLLGAVDGSQVADGAPDGPVMLHLTACPAHVREVRRWLTARTPFPEDIQTWKTTVLMEHWGQVEHAMEDTPIYSMRKAG
jgi:hypothetical protein